MSTKKSQKKNEIATSSQFTQEMVPTMLQQVKDKISQLKTGDEETALIDKPLGSFGMVQQITDPLVLRVAYAYITKKAAGVDDYNEVFQDAVRAIKITPFKENGYTVNQWQTVILAQYRKATRTVELEKLEKIAKELEECLSTEDKMRSKLGNISDLLNS